MKKLNNYRGYHPLEFVVLQYNKNKNLEISDALMCQNISGFLYYYLMWYYSADVMEIKDLLLSDDKESQLLGLQICCRDFIDTFNLIMEVDYSIIEIVIIRLQDALRRT